MRHTIHRTARAKPDYPFAEENLETSVTEIDRFIAEPALSAFERGEVLEFIRLTRQYAFLERLIQGQILYELPVHIDSGAPRTREDESHAEELAEEERRLLDLGIGPAELLAEALDERGIKVFHRSHGPESPEKLTGGFRYIGEEGPAILVGAVEGSPEMAFILAHEYGHLVMDMNPYRSRLCRWRRFDLRNVLDTVEERRADRFARALLVPRELLQRFAQDLGLDHADRDQGARAILRSAEMFGVAPAVIWQRLADLGMPRVDDPPEPPSADLPREVDDRRPTDLPERFVNLALAAFGQRYIEKTELARFLRIAPDRLERFLAWCPIPRMPVPLDGEEVEEGTGEAGDRRAADEEAGEGGNGHRD